MLPSMTNASNSSCQTVVASPHPSPGRVVLVRRLRLSERITRSVPQALWSNGRRSTSTSAFGQCSGYRSKWSWTPRVLNGRPARLLHRRTPYRRSRLLARISSDDAAFREVFVDYGTLVWPGDVDLAPETLIWDGPYPDDGDTRPSHSSDSGRRVGRAGKARRVAPSASSVRFSPHEHMRPIRAPGQLESGRIGRFGSPHENFEQIRVIDLFQMSHVLAPRESRGGRGTGDGGRGRGTVRGRNVSHLAKHGRESQNC
jgi:hypothetical protein